MSIRKHRDKAEGINQKFRMPKREDIKTGTRIHEHRYEDEEEDIPDTEKCPLCGRYSETVELADFKGNCYDCYLDKKQGKEIE